MASCRRGFLGLGHQDGLCGEEGGGDHLGNRLHNLCSDCPPTKGEQDLACRQAGHCRCHRLRLCEKRRLQLRWGGLQDGEEVEGRWGGWNNSRCSMERGSEWEEGLGLGLGVVEHGLHAVVRHCHQVRLLVSHRLEYGGAAEIHWNFDRFKGGDGGEEGACVCDQLNFRGSTIFQTVTDQKTDLVTVTDYSVQTVLNYAQSKSQPFLPLAPTLHRAARVVPASPPPLNLLPILQTSPPQLQTSLLTQTETVTSTVTSLATSQILLTLGGRAITTEIVEPVTQVVTSTLLSTQSVLVAESQKASPARSLRKLQLLQAILGLRRA